MVYRFIDRFSIFLLLIASFGPANVINLKLQQKIIQIRRKTTSPSVHISCKFFVYVDFSCLTELMTFAGPMMQLAKGKSKIYQ